MHNEDTGEEIQCVYCGSPDDCAHLLAVIDKTFVECSGGWAYDRYGEFQRTIEKVFLASLLKGSDEQPVWEDPELVELWTGAVADYSADDEYVSLDGSVLNRLIIELFNEAGGDEYPGPIDDGGGPGFASAITLFYAQNPQDVFELALSKLSEQLGNQRTRRTDV